MEGDRSAVTFLLLLLGWFALWLVFRKVIGRPPGFERQWQRAATALGGTFHPGSTAGPPRVEFRIRDRRAAISFDRESEQAEVWTGVEVDMRGSSPGALMIGPRAGAVEQARRLPSVAVRSGDARFDARYVVTANPVSLAHALFERSRQGRSVVAIRRLEGHGEPIVELSRQVLFVGVRRHASRPAAVLALAAAATELVDALLDVVPVVGIHWLEATETSEGQCEVCGGSLSEGPVVRCQKCRTPHHRECWDFNGRCATFGCGESRAV
ncbi:MAG TPA: RING finger protein [Planctomycetota bacterium]|nr:RING finger protein [Planctomycetota bacterium]